MPAVPGRQVRTNQGLWSGGEIARAVVHQRGTARDGMEVVERLWVRIERLSGKNGMESRLISFGHDNVTDFWSQYSIAILK